MSLNILIVEDCDLVRKVMVRTLGLARIPLANLHEAADGREALRIVRENWIDLILADLNMPVMDGVEMIEHLHAEGLLKTIPVVVVSTEGSETRMEELRRKGVAAYVRKPFTPEEIRDVVWEALGRPDAEERARLLSDVFCQVTERFALMIGERDESGAPQPMDGWLQAKLSFRGPLSGTLAAAAPPELLREIAANVLGVDAEDAEAADGGPAALAELVNLLAGRMLTAVADVVAVHDLASPVVGEPDRGDWTEDDGRTVVWFRVEGAPIAVSLDLRRAAPPEIGRPAALGLRRAAPPDLRRAAQ